MSDERSLSDMLSDPALVASKAYVGGVWEDAQEDATFTVINPSNGACIARVADVGAEQAERAVDAAYGAQKAWAARTAKDRSATLQRWHDLIIAHAEDLAIILTAEMGKPLAEARAEIAYGASFVTWYIEEAKRVYGDTIPALQENKRYLVLKQPVGVVASITPWNFPNAMVTRKAAPALAVGCSFVLKPAPQTPLSGLALAVLAERAGLPAGIFSVLPSSNPAPVGEVFCKNDKVRKLSFTGSTNVGRLLMRQCADQVKKVTLELGGNAPFIVFDDADIDAAVEGAMISKFRNNGQTCVCANRLYVHTRVYDAFTQKLTRAVEALRPGDGFETGITTGPVINGAGVEKIERHIRDAQAKGAQIVTGGKRHALGGLFFEPTILTELTSAMEIAHEETFGPVAGLFRFEDEEDVIAQANDTIYGLACYFYARDIRRVWRVAEALEYGIVGVNTGLISTEVAPFGGIKHSGLGREGSRYGTDEFLELKYICLDIS